MKKVEFVRIKADLIGFGVGKGIKSRFESIENIIKERIENGWSYMGYVPIETRGTGDIETLSLIFQRNE